MRIHCISSVLRVISYELPTISKKGCLPSALSTRLVEALDDTEAARTRRLNTAICSSSTLTLTLEVRK